MSSRYEGLYHNNADPYIREQNALARARYYEQASSASDPPHCYETVPATAGDSSPSVPQSHSHPPYASHTTPVTTRGESFSSVAHYTADPSSTRAQVTASTAPGLRNEAGPSSAAEQSGPLHNENGLLNSVSATDAVFGAGYDSLGRSLAECKDKINGVTEILERIRSQLNAHTRNTNARRLNVNKRGDDILSMLYDEFDRPIPNFPRTPAAIDTLELHEVDAIICALGTQLAHIQGDHRQALRLLIGI
ncbi:hypothetical protein AYL99_11763 [Fonsecaea erecta]|uniref:Uncharacterized protein n=1 Tax=Fonsecaea erecta TaxID=1367422 RepID=A0A178Z477_9EURO|nr:hypothetical protein AYL99_11763 [Fonsecaea erecta]OAP54003.1 hypothetical protein AYL99_11763 [Fonsecaea erecta]